jgi:hypothetical protein
MRCAGARLLGGLLLAILIAGAMAVSASASTIGYVYAGGENLETFAVGEDGELTAAGTTSVTSTTVVGLAVAPTQSGVYVYALSGATLDEFKASPLTGALSPVGNIPAPKMCPETGNNLYLYDEGEGSAASLFAPGCELTPEHENSGIRTFTIDTASGALTDHGEFFFPETDFQGMAIAGDELTYAYPKGMQTDIASFAINHLTGLPEPLQLEFGMNDGADHGTGDQRSSPGVAAATHDLVSFGNISPIDESNTSDGIGTYSFDAGGQGIVLERPDEVDAMAYTPSWLVAGERGPRLEMLGIGAIASGGPVIDLTQPPTSLPAQEGGFEQDGIETIFALGPFFYVGITGEPAVELVDEPKEAVSLMAEPFVSGSGSVKAMGGFLTAEVPTPSGEGAGGGTAPVGGTVEGGGKPPAPPAPPITGSTSVSKLIKLGGATTAKLKNGAIKLVVTCGLPCTVGGSVLPPGAKAAGSRPRALPFKSIKLPGSGKPVTVTLRFTHIQKLLIARLLKKHERVSARITVSEAPGGAPSKSKLLKITR